MPEQDPSSSEFAAATGSRRSLLLTARQDAMGFARRIAGRIALAAVASMAILMVLLIFAFIIWKAWPFFAERGAVEFFSSLEWYPSKGDYGALPMLYGSAIVTVTAMIVAVPIGLLTAVFLSDIVPFGIRQIIKPIIELLAAIPSVAYGFFAILVAGPWMQRNLGLDSSANALNASLVLAVMAMPTIVSISEDALTAAGRELREGAYALGATRAEVITKVVIPAAHSGVIAAIILGIMRAVGETMAVWMAAGMARQIPTPWWDLTASVRTITATIAQEMGDAPENSLHRQALFALGLVLLLVTFVLSLSSEYVMTRSKRTVKAKPK